MAAGLILLLTRRDTGDEPVWLQEFAIARLKAHSRLKARGFQRWFSMKKTAMLLALVACSTAANAVGGKGNDLLQAWSNFVYRRLTNDWLLQG
jgi:hypothetical protein